MILLMFLILMYRLKKIKGKKMRERLEADRKKEELKDQGLNMDEAPNLLSDLHDEDMLFE